MCTLQSNQRCCRIMKCQWVSNSSVFLLQQFSVVFVDTCSRLGPNAPPHLYDVEVGLHFAGQPHLFVPEIDADVLWWSVVQVNFHWKKFLFDSLYTCKVSWFCLHCYAVSRFTEVLKLLKALQFEIAASWASMWRGMLQEKIDKCVQTDYKQQFFDRLLFITYWDDWTTFSFLVVLTSGAHR